MENIIQSKYAITASNKLLNVNFFIKYDDYNILHKHDYFEFFAVLDGNYKHNINGYKETLSSGDGYFLRPNDIHKFESDSSKVKHLNIMIKTSFFKKCCNNLSPTLYDQIIKQDKINMNGNSILVNKLIYYLSNIYKTDNNKYNSNLLETLSTNLIIDFIINKLNIINNQMPIWLSDFLNDLSKPEHLHWTVEEAVNSCHYSHTHLARILKQYTGMSIIKYIQNIKMEYATRYLLYSNKSVVEISNILGYANVSHFNHIFKNVFKMAPLQYRTTQSKDSAYMSSKQKIL